jgi:hypothetical protein
MLYILHILYIIYLFMFLWSELRTSHLLGRCSTTFAMSPALFTYSYIWDKIACFCQDHSTYASHIAGITGTCHTLNLFVQMKVSLTFCQGWSQSGILISASQAAVITSMYHYTYPMFYIFDVIIYVFLYYVSLGKLL